jgi:hypothetical protein
MQRCSLSPPADPPSLPLGALPSPPLPSLLFTRSLHRPCQHEALGVGALLCNSNRQSDRVWPRVLGSAQLARRQGALFHARLLIKKRRRAPAGLSRIKETGKGQSKRGPRYAGREWAGWVPSKDAAACWHSGWRGLCHWQRMWGPGSSLIAASKLGGGRTKADKSVFLGARGEPFLVEFLNLTNHHATSHQRSQCPHARKICSREWCQP